MPEGDRNRYHVVPISPENRSKTNPKRTENNLPEATLTKFVPRFVQISAGVLTGLLALDQAHAFPVTNVNGAKSHPSADAWKAVGFGPADLVNETAALNTALWETPLDVFESGVNRPIRGLADDVDVITDFRGINRFSFPIEAVTHVQYRIGSRPFNPNWLIIACDVAVIGSLTFSGLRRTRNAGSSERAHERRFEFADAFLTGTGEEWDGWSERCHGNLSFAFADAIAFVAMLRRQRRFVESSRVLTGHRTRDRARFEFIMLSGSGLLPQPSSRTAATFTLKIKSDGGLRPNT